MGAREFFQSVREAALDAQRCHDQLAAMEESALRISGPSMEGRVTGCQPDGMERRVVSLVSREAMLHKRIEADYQLLDLAFEVCYGHDLGEGLAALVPSWWVDALWMRYGDGWTWEAIGQSLGYSGRRCVDVVNAAIDAADAHGLTATVEGRGFAEM